MDLKQMMMQSMFTILILTLGTLRIRKEGNVIEITFGLKYLFEHWRKKE
jgi:hypothetical protein